MKKIFLASFLLFSNVANAQLGQDNMAELAEASVRLKEAHVQREWTGCMSKIDNEVRCKKSLNILWEQEKAVLKRLAEHSENNSINVDVLAKQSAACYDPTGDYTSLIKCWERLEARATQALNGETLLSKQD